MKTKNFILTVLTVVCMAFMAQEANCQIPGQKAEKTELHPYTYAEVFGTAPASATKKFEQKQFSIVVSGGEMYYGKIQYGVKVPSRNLKYSNANKTLNWMDKLILYKSGGKYYFVLCDGKTNKEIAETLKSIGEPDK